MPHQAPNTGPVHETQQYGSDDVQRMLGKPPGWALRWGITAVFLAVLLLLALSWLIRYPDTVQARVVLTTTQPPIRLVAEQSSRLQALMVEDGERVAEGQIIAVWQNSALIADILRLEAWLLTDSTAAPPPGLVVGDIQPLYAQLIRQYEDLRFFQQRTDVAMQLATLEQQMEHRRALGRTLAQKEKALQLELELSRRNLSRNQELAQSGNLSQVELEQTEASLLRLQRQLEDVRAEWLVNQVSTEEIKASRIQLNQLQSTEGMRNRLSVQETWIALREAIRGWKQEQLTVAPISGIVSMPQKLVAGQYLEAGQLLMTVVPQSGAGALLARGYLPVRNSGSVEVGMRVQLFLEAYPHQQFGALPGRLKSMSMLPDQGQYFIEVSLPQGMKTTYEEELEFSQELTATASIITEDRRLLSRLIAPIRSLWSNY